MTHLELLNETFPQGSYLVFWKGNGCLGRVKASKIMMQEAIATLNLGLTQIDGDKRAYHFQVFGVK